MKNHLRSPFAKKISALSGRYATWEIWSDFITMFAIAISNSVDLEHWEERENTYETIRRKYTNDEMSIIIDLITDVITALGVNPDQDYLGEAYMELELNNHWTGQFFTPYNICRLMAEMTTHGVIRKIKHQGFVTINDPACGAGATLIAGANEVKNRLAKMRLSKKPSYQNQLTKETKIKNRQIMYICLHIKKSSRWNWQNHVIVCGQDIDYVVGLMAYIQLSLIGCAGFIKIGNSLTSPICESEENYDNYWFMPMHSREVQSAIMDNTKGAECDGEKYKNAQAVS